MVKHFVPDIDRLADRVASVPIQDVVDISIAAIDFVEVIAISIVTDPLVWVWPDLSFIIPPGFPVPAYLACSPIETEHFWLCARLYGYQNIPSLLSETTDLEGFSQAGADFC